MGKAKPMRDKRTRLGDERIMARSWPGKLVSERMTRKFVDVLLGLVA